MPYRIEQVDDIVSMGEQLWPMLSAHRDELATHKHLMRLEPDLDRYRAMQDAGLLLSLVAYDADGEDPIGYSVSFLSTHLHYQRLYYAHNDVLYIAPEYRSRRVGYLLIRETEARAKAAGAQFIVWHAKPNTALDSVLPRMGYGLQDILYSKEL